MALGQELVLADLHPSLKSGAIWGSEWQTFMGTGQTGTGGIQEYTGEKGDFNRSIYDAMVFRAVDVRGGAMTQAPLKVYAPRRGARRRKEVEHDALDVMRHTNPSGWLAGDLLLQATLASQDLWGHYCWQLAFGRNKLPTEIYFIPPAAYEPKADRDGFFMGIKVRDRYDGSREKIIDAKELVYDATMSLTNPLVGTSKIRAAQMDLNLRAYGQASNLWFLRNNMRPDWLLSGDFAPTQENVDRIRRLINQWAGGDNRRGPLILGGGHLQAHLLTVDRKDAEWVQQQRLAQENIASIFGVPMTMMGVLENATLANVEALNVIFWKDTMFPELKRMADGLTRTFLWRWPDARRAGLEFGFDLAAIEGLGEDIGKIWERFLGFLDRINKQVSDGTMVPDQAREATVNFAETLGIDPAPWMGKVPQGDDRLVNWNFIPSQQASLGAVINIMAARGPNAGIIQDLPGAEGFEAAAQDVLQIEAARASQPPASGQRKPPPTQGLKAGSSNTSSMPLDAHRKAQEPRKADKRGPHPGPVRDRRLEPVQQKTVKRLKKYFQGLQTQTLRELRKRDPVLKADDFWDQAQSAEDLVAIMDDAIAQSGEAAFIAAAQEYGLSISWDVSNPWLPAYVGQRASLIKGIDQTTLDLLLGALQQGYDAGEGVPDLSQRVTEVFAEAIGSRSEMIARTETLQAYGAASLQAYAQAGIGKAQIFDGQYDPECAAVDGMVVTLDEAQQLMGDEHPNGTRAVAPFIELDDAVLPIQTFEPKGVTIHPGAITIQILPG